MTPYAQLLHMKLSPGVIAQSKAMFGDDISSGKITLMNANDYFKQTEKFRKIIFNVQSLDRLTEGGIDVGAVTEIFGEAGTGKTQLCMQLALNCALPVELNGLNGRTCYVSTDKPFPTNRLAQMTEGSRYAAHGINFLDLIHIWQYYTLAELQFFVKEELPTRLQTCPNIRLVIIDSLAGIFRYETDYIKRARDMRELFHDLHQLTAKHEFAIVATNHITSVPQADGSSKNESACGQAWNNLVDVKLRIRKTEKFLPSKDSELNRIRAMEIVYSPRLYTAKANFGVDLTGVIDSSSITVVNSRRCKLTTV